MDTKPRLRNKRPSRTPTIAIRGRRDLVLLLLLVLLVLLLLCRGLVDFNKEAVSLVSMHCSKLFTRCYKSTTASLFRKRSQSPVYALPRNKAFSKIALRLKLLGVNVPEADQCQRQSSGAELHAENDPRPHSHAGSNALNRYCQR